MKLTKLHFLLYLLNATNLIFSAGNKIYKLFPDIERLFFDNNNLIKKGFLEKELTKLKNPDWKLIDDALDWAGQDDHYIITIYDSYYPHLLKEIQNPPFLLFAAGNLGLLNLPQLAMVGSRNPTPVGLEIAKYFSESLSKVGFVITSGFAAGIDAASHFGALNKTIAVMGTGLKRIYPRRHKYLAQDIIASGGLLLSEYPLNAQAKAWHFPLRNRIISGLSLGTLVVEATMRSGSLITARHAVEQGREVFAIPGSIYNPAARGCHHLIGQGAKLTENPLDILDEFSAHFGTFFPKKAEIGSLRMKNKLDCGHKKLLDCMGFEIVTLDVLAERANLPVSKVGIILLDLELEGMVNATAGGYIRA